MMTFVVYVAEDTLESSSSAEVVQVDLSLVGCFLGTLVWATIAFVIDRVLWVAIIPCADVSPFVLR